MLYFNGMSFWVLLELDGMLFNLYLETILMVNHNI
jgi:hypothetical protein